MAKAAELRRALAAFLGDEQFRKFVKQGFLRGRLRYWQEQDWDRFAGAHLEFAMALDELATALRICELHGHELIHDTIRVLDPCPNYTGKYINARNRLFPRAASERPTSTADAPLQGEQVALWFCPACRQAAAEWAATRRQR